MGLGDCGCDWCVAYDFQFKPQIHGPDTDGDKSSDASFCFCFSFSFCFLFTFLLLLLLLVTIWWLNAYDEVAKGKGGGAAGERASPSANGVVTIIIGFVRRPVPHPSAPAPPAPSLFGGR